MSDPIAFPEQNGVLQAPQDSEEYCRQIPLPIHRRTVDGVPEVICKWRLSPEEILRVAETGEVWVSMVGMSVPPHYVSADIDFTISQ